MNALPPGPALCSAARALGGHVAQLAGGLLSKAAGKRRLRGRRPASLDHLWHGAAKLERLVGDTVISVAISEDERCVNAAGCRRAPADAACRC